MDKIIIEKPSEEKLAGLGVKFWPIWEKEISTFPWHYDCDEYCYLLEGEVEIETSEGIYSIKAGDFVTFKKGLLCTWNVKKAVRKHYKFD